MSPTPNRRASGGNSDRRLADAVGAKFGALRRAIRLRLAAEGICWALVAAVAVVLATLTLDYGLRLEQSHRALVMTVAMAGLGWVIWSRTVRPLAAPIRLLDLSLLLERRFPRLQARLVSAVQFDCESLPPGTSRAMADRVVAEANDLARPLPFKDVVERRQLRRMLRVTLSALGLLAGLAIWQTDLVRLWAMRNIAFADVAWPQRTYLTLQGGPDFTLVRGDDLHVAVVVEAGSTAPATVTLHARYPSIGRTEEPVRLAGDNGPRYDIVFRTVTEPFEFYVTGGDDERDKRRPHRVCLVDAPALADLHFVVESPAYMRRPDQPVGGTGGMLVIPVGGGLRIEAMATKDLAAAEALLRDDEQDRAQPLRVEAISKADPRPRRLVGRLTVGQVNEARPMTLRLRLTDVQGYQNRRGATYVVHLQPDTAPSVQLRKSGVGAAVTPQAIVPLLIRVKDDAGLASVNVSLALAGTAEPSAVEPIPMTAGATPLDLTQRYEFDLAGRAPAPGETIVLSAEAVDILPGDFGGPNTGRSGNISLRIISSEELLADLIMRQKAIRTEFLQALSQQNSAVAKSAAAGKGLTDEAIAAEVRTRLADSAGLQRSVHTEVVKTREKLLLIADEMAYNRVGAATDVQHLRTGIIEPLGQVAAAIEAALAELERAAVETAPPALAERIDEIAGRQKQIAVEMQTILQRMAKLQSRQELANRLQVILQWSQQILEGINRRQEQEIGKAFDSTNRRKPGD